MFWGSFVCFLFPFGSMLTLCIVFVLCCFCVYFEMPNRPNLKQTKRNLKKNVKKMVVPVVVERLSMLKKCKEQDINIKIVPKCSLRAIVVSCSPCPSLSFKRRALEHKDSVTICAHRALFPLHRRVSCFCVH